LDINADNIIKHNQDMRQTAVNARHRI